jgi:hypothetical protein
MGEPAFHFQSRVGPWRDHFAWLPTRLFDGHWVWLTKVRRAKYQTHAYLDGPLLDGWVYADADPSP